LPNGLEIAHLNQYETDYLYREIFEDQCYLRHGIQLQDGATVVDIGANIGLFSLFVLSRCANPTIYAVEPAPVLYDILKANCAAYGANAHALNLGVSDCAKTGLLTFYENSSVFSGFHSDEAEDREAIHAIVRNVLNREPVASGSLEEYIEELTADRLRRRTCECRMASLSDIIREHGIDKIDLLKIDAEKSESDIIAGIDAGDWPKIDQIVIEIHDRTRETVRRIETLLSEKGYRCAVEQETLLENAGLFNLYATRREATDVAARTHPAHETALTLNRNIEDFSATLQSFRNQTATPLVVCLCPMSPAAQADAERAAALNHAEESLASQARKIANVHVVPSATPLRHYPVNDYYDLHGHHAGHMPYTPEGYAAIGTELVRTLFNLRGNPYKVIVLDCDNTLWRGVCGEDGCLGVEVTPSHRILQQFMIAQMAAGMLLCLCSRNNEKDVLEVFNRRTDMLLKREHLVSWRINWSSKSENLKSLAQELNLGLDSFIFLDDNPLECAEVKAHCPGVLTLQSPADPGLLPAFLSHIWAFDHAGSTAEDRNRTRMYRQTAEREHYRTQSFSLKDFVEGLQLRVEIGEATEAQFGRISQLSRRTNQFNFTTIQRSENEIRNLLKEEHVRCLAVRVSDRFGDYGLVGAVMYQAQADRYIVDTLLLSCRVLNRGVEHAVLAHLGARALREGKRWVQLTYLPTEKNLPAGEFIAAIGAGYRSENSSCWLFPAGYLASLGYDPEQMASARDRVAPVQAEERMSRPDSPLGSADRPARLQRIGEELHDIGHLAKAIQEHRLRKQPLAVDVAEAPRSDLETALARIWSTVLGRTRIGINENFFDVGGTSLRAVQVVAMIKKELNRTLSIVNLFECPTLALLAARLSAVPAPSDTGTAAAGAALRGQQRRNKAMLQHTS
jgi:FkbH-like protein/FkbM family methyltransferase